MDWFQKFYGKTPYVTGKNMVSCRFSLEPIHWFSWGPKPMRSAKRRQRRRSRRRRLRWRRSRWQCRWQRRCRHRCRCCRSGADLGRFWVRSPGTVYSNHPYVSWELLKLLNDLCIYIYISHRQQAEKGLLHRPRQQLRSVASIHLPRLECSSVLMHSTMCLYVQPLWQVARLCYSTCHWFFCWLHSGLDSHLQAETSTEDARCGWMRMGCARLLWCRMSPQNK